MDPSLKFPFVKWTLNVMLREKQMVQGPTQAGTQGHSEVQVQGDAKWTKMVSLTSLNGFNVKPFVSARLKISHSATEFETHTRCTMPDFF